MPQHRLKILPDRIFHKLWDGCKSVESEDEYIKMFISPLSSDYIDFFKKYDIAELQAGEMLKSIYHAYHLSFQEILALAEVRQSEVSHIFCIPIRTVEEWHTGNNRCPGYIKLMLLKHFYLLNLGKYIAIESDIRRRDLKPSIYNKKDESHAHTSAKDVDGSHSDKKISRMTYDQWKEDLDSMEYITPAQEILRRTDYLKERIKSDK